MSTSFVGSSFRVTTITTFVEHTGKRGLSVKAKAAANMAALGKKKKIIAANGSLPPQRVAAAARST